MIESLGDIFKEESLEILGELEHSLLELEESPDDQEVIGRVFRSLHTIKGSGGMAGLNDISAFAHEVETVFEEVRSGAIVVTPLLVNLTLAARDQIKRMVDAYCGGAPVDAAEIARISAGLRLLVAAGGKAAPLTEARQTAVAVGGMVTYRIRFHLDPNIFFHGVNPLYLLKELQRLGDCWIVAQTDAIPPLEEFDPERCYLYWDVILTTDRGQNAIEDVFIFVADTCRLEIHAIDDDRIVDDGDYKRLGEILIERGDLRAADLLAALSERQRLGDVLVEKKLATPGQISAALVEQERVQQQRESRKITEFASSIRVRSDKLDSLVNLIGELVTVQARLSQIATEQQGADLLNVSEVVERLTWELRDQVLTIRMLPIGTTFNKLRRLVHDLSQELDKNIQLVTEGAETELDKTVIERLNDPLVHLIRNCIDHGIEAPEVRAQKGKPRNGAVFLSAVHEGANVVLRVRDDGAGINREAVRRRAEQQGLLTPGAEVGDRDLFACILAPGFSTATTVTEVSGRGVGMDVVRQAVEALRGVLDIASTPGQGTTFTIKLPLTLAIIDGLLVQLAGDHYVLPLAAVEECIELRRDDAVSHGRNIVIIRGEIVPFIRLRDFFAIATAAPEIEQIVIVNVEGARVGFALDAVIGQHQTVIKSLGKVYQEVQGISGATILGNGSVALILDLPQLARAQQVLEAAAVA